MKYARIKDNTIKQEETVGSHRDRPLRYNNLKMTSNTTEEMYINSDEDWRIVNFPVVSDTEKIVQGKVIHADRVDAYGVMDKTAQELQEEAAAAAEEQEVQDEILRSPLDGRTFAQVAAYVDNNVTDLASAKVVMKKFAKAILILNKRMMR